VHYAPHFPIDATLLGVDFLLCSAYKFYGPHVGILYSREGALDALETDRLRTQNPRAPARIETGTLNHASLAGVGAAVEYISSFGRDGSRRGKIVSAMSSIGAHERDLAQLAAGYDLDRLLKMRGRPLPGALRLYRGLKEIDGVTVRGPSFDVPLRAPTVSFTVDGMRPSEVCTRLGGKGICAWDGDFYAVRPMEVLGLEAQGGVTRIGISLYNSREEIDRVLQEVAHIARRP
jgi:selenocysteine lyase/cysteine desulfurase